MELVKRKIFNELGDDALKERRILGGNSTGIFNLNSIKYGWAGKLNKIMINNFWIPEKVSLVDDKVTIKELTSDELEALKNTLSFLIALDSMQVTNIPNLGEYITAPEVSALFTIQAFQELIHSQSYQYLLQELFPSIEREEIYNYWRTNPILLERNKTIAGFYQQFEDNKNLETFKLAVAADFALEGLYLYNGFQFFYQLASRNKIANVARMIKYIENDEVTHVSLMSYIIRDIFDLENESDKNILITCLTEATEQEIRWGQSVYGNKILGISEESTENYNKFLCNQRCKLIGLSPIYKGFTKNPYEYLDGKEKENFFETKITQYSQSSAVDGWDNF
jgi:ribonucleoside-diphosphate reductase beta chain